MSELTAYNSERIYWAVEQVEREAGDIDTLHLDDNLFYLKLDVDKKIAELQSKVTLASLAEDCSNLRNKRCNYCSALQYQKYKRCLAKKAECKLRSERYQDLWEKWRKTEYDTSGSYYKNYIKWWHRAMKWKDLAEKFKPTNSTAQ